MCNSLIYLPYAPANNAILSPSLLKKRAVISVKIDCPYLTTSLLSRKREKK
jgi:hypothetical protein